MLRATATRSVSTNNASLIKSICVPGTLPPSIRSAGNPNLPPSFRLRGGDAPQSLTRCGAVVVYHGYGGKDWRLLALVEHPYCLIDWYEMVNFNASRFFGISQALSNLQHLRVEPDRPLNELNRKTALGALQIMRDDCNAVGLQMAVISLDRITERLIVDNSITYQQLAAELPALQDRIRDEMSLCSFFQIRNDKKQYYESTVPLFGESVQAAFVSAASDIRESGNCLALGRNTACVFHLMRVLEIGLTALGAVFSVSLAHTNWAPAIEEIEKRIREMHKDPTWKSRSDCKDLQERYAQAASHFGILKDAWRNYTAHARGKYDEAEAFIIFLNVQGFVQKLATIGLKE